jgi:seryl-tRNA synthetase
VDAQKVRELKTSVYCATTQSKLMRNKNEGLRASLVTKNKRRRHSKVLLLAQTLETGRGGAFYSPRKVAKGRAEMLGKKQKELQEKAAKAKIKDLKAASKLLKEKLLQEKRVAAAEAKLVKEKEKAKKVAEKARNIEARNTQKAIQQAQNGKRKALQASSTKNKRQKQSSSGAATAEGRGASIAPPPKVTSRGRSIKVPQKFR